MGAVQSGFCSIHHARPLPAPGTETDFGAAFAKSQAAAMNPAPLFARARADLAARGQTFTCP